jgi:predicted metalloendopeptidase
VARVLALSGITDPSAADRVLALESRLAEAERAREELHNPAATYNVYRAVVLENAFPGFGWRRFLNQLDLDEAETIVVEQPRHLRAVARLVGELPLADWRHYLRWQLLRRYAPLLPRAYREADFAFYGATLSGSRTERPRGDAAMLFTEGAMGEAVGRLWAERHLDRRAKEQVAALAEHIRATFAKRIRASSWLEPATKSAALEKLSKLLIKVAYPDVRTNYSALSTAPDDVIGNARSFSAWAWRSKLARLAHTNDRTRWLDVPQSTSAYYNRSTNELALPAGLLQAPWFDANADLASNLGALGAVIGHEMGHAFDDQGSHFDGDGNVREWWTRADRARFEERVRGLVEQYSRFEPLPGLRVNGALSLSENIGDLTGLSLAHATLLRLRAGSIRPEEERRFFSSFCVRWRANYREQLIRRIVSSDGHPPQQYRCNGPLQNFQPFYRAYRIGRGDGMYRPEAERISIW